jgi:hypothetical protein
MQESERKHLPVIDLRAFDLPLYRVGTMSVFCVESKHSYV